MRHGPHHGAQKSTTTGIALLFAAASNVAESVISIGASGGASAVLHCPQRVVRPRASNARRFARPQFAQFTITPLVSLRGFTLSTPNSQRPSPKAQAVWELGVGFIVRG